MYYMNLFKKTMGENLFNLAMKMTVYGQFVAGEDKDKIKVFTFKSIIIYT